MLKILGATVQNLFAQAFRDMTPSNLYPCNKVLVELSPSISVSFRNVDTY